MGHTKVTVCSLANLECVPINCLIVYSETHVLALPILFELHSGRLQHEDFKMICQVLPISFFNAF